MKQHSKLIGAFCLLCPLLADAQHYRYSASLPPVAISGFYRIIVTPLVGAYSATDLHDIRIREASGLELPYLRSAELPPRSSDSSRNVEVPAPAWTQIDRSDHNSYIQLRFQHPYLIEKLSLEFEAPTFYRREVALYVDDYKATEFTVRTGPPTLVQPQLHNADVLLIVHNEDSPPIHLKRISASQHQQYLMAYLMARTPYTLTFGDSTLAAPLYDLRYFKDSVFIKAMKEVEPLAPAAISYAASPATSPAAKPLIGKPTMWIIIIIVLAALIPATIALMKQIKSNGEER